VPIPRRFDRRPPERDTTRINDRIRVPEVRLIDENGEQLGIVPTPQALERARENDLDLVEIAPTAKPPVTRILDYSKYKYEQEQRKKAARRHQQQVTVREMKLRPKIATHDYETKKGHILRFLGQNNKVKVTIMFRGREQAHPERGEALLRKLAAELQELATIESEPNQEGRNMTMMLAPLKSAVNSKRPQEAPAETETPPETASAETQPAPETAPAETEASSETASAETDAAPTETEPAEAPAEESAA
jgi:translation initiation factor IF-3